MAKRFHFPLETLLKVRRLNEREAKRKVATQQAEIARLNQLNVTTRREISTQQTALLQNQREGLLNPAALSQGRAWIAYLCRTIADRRILQTNMLARLEQRRAEFQAARKQTRIIEKLRERRWGEYIDDRRRREQSETEELAQQLHCYKQASLAPPARESGGITVRAAGRPDGR